MGISAGGYIKQYIGKDPCKPESWDHSSRTVFNAQILDANSFQRITGYAAPKCPIEASTYASLGLPYFHFPETPTSITGEFADLKPLNDSSWSEHVKVVLTTSSSGERFRSVYEVEEEAMPALPISAEQMDEASAPEDEVQQVDDKVAKRKKKAKKSEVTNEVSSSKRKFPALFWSRLTKKNKGRSN